MQAIPVFTYHHILPHPVSGQVQLDHFQDQLRSLSSANYRTIDCGELYAFLNGDLKLPCKTVMLTFDDGWRDNYIYARPVLEKYNMKAVIFVNTEYIRENEETRGPYPEDYDYPSMQAFLKQEEIQPHYCTWNELRDMKESGIMDIQSHTMNHRLFLKQTDSIEKNRERLAQSLSQSREQIEKHLNAPCNGLAWPWGRYNAEYIRLAREAGYRMLFTTNKGTNTADQDSFALNRIAVKDRGGRWLLQRSLIYRSSVLAKLYMKLRI